MTPPLQFRFRRSVNAPAFTLTEMMVVLVIVGLLAAIVGPRLFNRLDVAKERTARLQIENLASAVSLFRIDTGRLPTREEGLQVLISEPDDQVDWAGPYLAKDSIPLDPWGRPYVYQTTPEGKSFVIVSYGASGQSGGTGKDRPISSADVRGKAPAADLEPAPEMIAPGDLK